MVAATSTVGSTVTPIVGSTNHRHQYGRRTSPSTNPIGSIAALFAGLGLVTMALDTDNIAFAPLTTICENAGVGDEGTTATDDVDPYENLPVEDEPTHCSICLTYRQGPCRPLWRKVEACTKDNELPSKKEQDDREKNGEGNENEDEDDDDDSNRPDPPCLKYMMPWIECASGYRNLYAMIELDTNYTEGIEDLERTASKHLCWMPDDTPSVDWAQWQDYVNILNPQWTLPSPSPSEEQPTRINVKKPWVSDLFPTTRSSSKTRSESQSHPPKKTPLWKLLDQSSDPELVTVEAKVPSIREDSCSSNKIGVIECAYAIDQDGHVLGFAYGVRPSDAVAGKTPDTASSKDGGEGSKSGNDADADSGKNGGDDDGSAIAMTIRLLPNRTRHIVIAASYTQVTAPGTTPGGSDGDDEDDGDVKYETHVYKSKPMRLDEMAKIQQTE